MESEQEAIARLTEYLQKQRAWLDEAVGLLRKRAALRLHSTITVLENSLLGERQMADSLIARQHERIRHLEETEEILRSTIEAQQERIAIFEAQGQTRGAGWTH